jgi:hypothetical protein
MGGKRPDQHNIDPAEAGSTDYKWRGEGRSQEEHLKDESKRRFAANANEQPMIPEEHVNPALRELRERKAEAASGAGAASGRDNGAREDSGGMSAQNRETARSRGSSGQAREMTADERVDEQSEESFPASDPPQQP